ncbi:MAG TPA: hypothetical protein VHT23_08365 [Gemmatimonadaceae bacterium]|jgi:hypothetical protein|nr:hypothetical protein [Gemmatimonadaceae bacterium]
MIEPAETVCHHVRMPRHVIAPAPTSVTAFIWGNPIRSVEPQAVPVKSADEFVRLFGAVPTDAAVLRQFFEQGGTDAVIVPNSIIFPDPPASLAGVRFNILCQISEMPDYQELVDLCARKQAMAILHPDVVMMGNPAWPTRQLDMRITRNREWGAAYYPNLENDVAICGAVAGHWARIDREYGVWAAPSLPDHGVLTGFPPNGTADAWPVLGRAGINGILPLQDQTQIFGARTLDQRELTSPDGQNLPDWAVPLRRTLIFIEQSLRGGLEWAAQEKNGPALWSDVTDSIRHFLDSLMERKAFVEPYRLTCGAANNRASESLLHVSVDVAVQSRGVFHTVTVELPTA